MFTTIRNESAAAQQIRNGDVDAGIALLRR
jgi:hypothetical protein